MLATHTNRKEETKTINAPKGARYQLTFFFSSSFLGRNSARAKKHNIKIKEVALVIISGDDQTKPTKISVAETKRVRWRPKKGKTIFLP